MNNFIEDEFLADVTSHTDKIIVLVNDRSILFSAIIDWHAPIR